MSKKYTVLISDKEVINILDNLPQRGKGLYISQAIREKHSRDKGLLWDEKKLREIISAEVQKSINDMHK